MQYLLRNKIGLAILCLCISSAAIAQRDEVFRPNHDNNSYFFGISVGLSNYYTSYRLDSRFLSSGTSSQNPMSAIKISPINTTFFNLGLVGTKKISNNLYLRVNPNILISGNKSFKFNVKATKDSSQTFSTASTVIQLPIGIKFQSDRYNGFRFNDFMRHYLIVGGKFDFDLASGGPGKINPSGVFIPKDANSYPSILKGTDFGAEIGVGLSFYLRYATISPEVKFSYGFRDLKKVSPSIPLLSNLDKVNANFVYFTIHIEN
jgi:hypothetical protein